jgi:hypothetical protein
MAAREHRVSRRALLGAAFAALPASALPFPASSRRRPGPSPSEDSVRWNGVLARFRQAEAVLKAAAHEPDEERVVHPERLPCRQSKGPHPRPFPRGAEAPAPHPRARPPRAQPEDRPDHRPRSRRTHRRRPLPRRAEAGREAPRGCSPLVLSVPAPVKAGVEGSS